MKDRTPTQVLANGAIRYGIYDSEGALLRYEYIKPEDEPTQEGTPLNKATLLSDDTASGLGLTGDPTVDDALSATTGILSRLVIEKIMESCVWVAPRAMHQKFRVYAVGGGGGGGGDYGGGGGGGYIQISDLTIPNGTPVTITCGAVGERGSTTKDGGDGGTTMFGEYLSAPGGKGGKSQANGGHGGDGGAGGGGGYSSDGATNGGNGGNGSTYGGGGGGGCGLNAGKGGNGGDYGGGGGGGAYRSENAISEAGTGGTYGGDGGSGAFRNTGTPIAGSPGTPAPYPVLDALIAQRLSFEKSNAAGGSYQTPNRGGGGGGGGGFGSKGGSIFGTSYHADGGGGGGGFFGDGGDAEDGSSVRIEGGAGGGGYFSKGGNCTAGPGSSPRSGAGAGGGGLFCDALSSTQRGSSNGAGITPEGSGGVIIVYVKGD